MFYIDPDFGVTVLEVGLRDRLGVKVTILYSKIQHTHSLCGNFYSYVCVFLSSTIYPSKQSSQFMLISAIF